MLDKTRQKALQQWLNQQRYLGQRWLRYASLLGVVNGLLLVLQTLLLANLLQQLMVEKQPVTALTRQLICLALLFLLRATLNYWREKMGFRAGQAIRQHLRQQALTQLQQQGPLAVKQQAAGYWSTLLVDSIDELHDYYARYLPQLSLAAAIPLIILLTIFPLNWAAGLILLCTAPLIPLFMILVGLGAAEANRRNFVALARLSSHFLDRLRGLETLRLFQRTAHTEQTLADNANQFRLKTMEVLRMAFLSSAVLEFFTAISIALVAVYFGFSYLGVLHFGSYGAHVSLLAGFIALILAPEFFQPLRELGTFYHAKAQAIGAADQLATFFATNKPASLPAPTATSDNDLTVISTLHAEKLVVLAADGTALTQPLTFTFRQGQRIALVGPSGAGKTALMQLFLGFLDYQGSLTINGIELRQLAKTQWQQQLNWVGQHPHLPAATIKENILLRQSAVDEAHFSQVCQLAGVSAFTEQLADGVDSLVGEQAHLLSVGQAQRVAIARALVSPCQWLLLDEPSASLDAQSEHFVMQAINRASYQQMTLLITHQLNYIANYDMIYVMNKGEIVQQGNYVALLAENGLFSQLIATGKQAI